MREITIKQYKSYSMSVDLYVLKDLDNRWTDIVLLYYVAWNLIIGFLIIFEEGTKTQKHYFFSFQVLLEASRGVTSKKK